MGSLTFLKHLQKCMTLSRMTEDLRDTTGFLFSYVLNKNLFISYSVRGVRIESWIVTRPVHPSVHLQAEIHPIIQSCMNWGGWGWPCLTGYSKSSWLLLAESTFIHLPVVTFGSLLSLMKSMLHFFCLFFCVNFLRTWHHLACKCALPRWHLPKNSAY